MSLTEVGSRLQKLVIENKLQTSFKKEIRRHLHYSNELMHDWLEIRVLSILAKINKCR